VRFQNSSAGDSLAVVAEIFLDLCRSRPTVGSVFAAPNVVRICASDLDQPPRSAVVLLLVPNHRSRRLNVRDLGGLVVPFRRQFLRWGTVVRAIAATGTKKNDNKKYPHYSHGPDSTPGVPQRARAVSRGASLAPVDRTIEIAAQVVTSSGDDSQSFVGCCLRRGSHRSLMRTPSEAHGAVSTGYEAVRIASPRGARARQVARTVGYALNPEGCGRLRKGDQDAVEAS